TAASPASTGMARPASRTGRIMRCRFSIGAFLAWLFKRGIQNIPEPHCHLQPIGSGYTIHGRAPRPASTMRSRCHTGLLPYFLSNKSVGGPPCAGQRAEIDTLVAPFAPAQLTVRKRTGILPRET